MVSQWYLNGIYNQLLFRVSWSMSAHGASPNASAKALQARPEPGARHERMFFFAGEYGGFHSHGGIPKWIVYNL